MFGGPRKKLEKRARAAGVDPAEAAQRVVRGVLIPWARSNNAAQLVPYLESVSPQDSLNLFEKIISQACDSVASRRLAQTGEDRTMLNAYFNQAYNPLIALIDAYQL
jgi:hypothetical protein